MMLKLWFPHIPIQSVSAASSITVSPARSLQDTSSSTPPHKHRDQLHIPVKVSIYIFLWVQVLTCEHTNNRPSISITDPTNWVILFTGKLLSCSFSRSADSAGQVQTPLHLPLCFSSALASVQKNGGWGKMMMMMMKGTTLLLHHWHLMQKKICQMWPTTVSTMRTQRERTVTVRTQVSCQSRIKQDKALSPAWHGCMLHPSCPHERPAPHMTVQQQQVPVKTSLPPSLSSHITGGVAQQRKTAPSPLPHSTSTTEIWRSQSGAKASLLLYNRVRVRPLRPARVKGSLLMSHLSLCPGCAPLL